MLGSQGLFHSAPTAEVDAWPAGCWSREERPPSAWS
jgi:hypothetical protein